MSDRWQSWHHNLFIKLRPVTASNTSHRPRIEHTRKNRKTKERVKPGSTTTVKLGALSTKNHGTWQCYEKNIFAHHGLKRLIQYHVVWSRHVLTSMYLTVLTVVRGGLIQGTVPP